jgi:hypothetical protein
MTVADPGYRAAVTAALSALPCRDVVPAASYFSTGQSRFLSLDGRQADAVIGLAGQIACCDIPDVDRPQMVLGLM